MAIQSRRSGGQRDRDVAKGVARPATSGARKESCAPTVAASCLWSVGVVTCPAQSCPRAWKGEASCSGPLRVGAHGRQRAAARARPACPRLQASARRRRLRSAAVSAVAESFDHAGSVRPPDPSLTAAATLGVVGSHPLQRRLSSDLGDASAGGRDDLLSDDEDASCSSNNRHAGTAHVPRAGGPKRSLSGRGVRSGRDLEVR